MTKEIIYTKQGLPYTQGRKEGNIVDFELS